LWMRVKSSAPSGRIPLLRVLYWHKPKSSTKPIKSLSNLQVKFKQRKTQYCTRSTSAIIYGHAQEIRSLAILNPALRFLVNTRRITNQFTPRMTQLLRIVSIDCTELIWELLTVIRLLIEIDVSIKPQNI
jgi:hypothetical protein